MSKTYRAAYFYEVESNGVGLVLTGEEHASLSDEALIEEAVAEAHRAGLIGADEEANQVTEQRLRSCLVIGDWTE